VLTDELADPRYRGFTICIIITFASGGILAITGLSALCEWRTAAGVNTAVTLLSVFPFLLVSDSPSWLVSKGRLEGAVQSLTWLWGPGKEMEVSLSQPCRTPQSTVSCHDGLLYSCLRVRMRMLGRTAQSAAMMSCSTAVCACACWDEQHSQLP
jgi:hypothetical protein